MDPISALATHINLQTLPISAPAPIPSSKSNTATQQLPTSTGDIQITTSINQLRSFSTALSSFISSYDELQNHINFINSSIDSKLPNHLLDGTNPNCSVLLETSCDRTVQNPRERVSDCELRYALEKVEATADVWKNHEEIEVCENFVEIDSLKQLEVDDKHEEIDVCEDPVEIDSLNIQEETVLESSCDETIADVSEAIVSEENPNRMAANCKQSNENVRTPECVEEIDVSVHKKIEENDICRKAFETVMLKKLEEIATLMSPDKINSSKTHGEIETVLVTSMRTPESFEEVDVLKKPAVVDIPKKVEVTDICKNSEHIDVLQEPGEHDTLMIPEEVGTLKKHEELDRLMIPEEFDTPKKPEESLPETSCDQTITMVPEAIVTEQSLEKPGKTETLKKHKENGTCKKAKKPKASRKSVVSNGEQSHKMVRTPEHLEENDVLNESEQADICKNPEESIVLKKPVELDIAVNSEEIDTSKNPEGNLPETSCDHTDICKNPEESTVLNKPPQTVVPKQLKKITTLKKHEENGTCKKANEAEDPKKFLISMLQSLCRGMCSKDMKWHVAMHYSEMINHREEISKSLKLAKDPAKLVLYSIGRFFIQDSKTFCNPQNKESLGRMASVLILECFVMISSDNGIVIAKRDRQYAAEAAVDWKKRMIKEGGLRHADEVDARGLLLLVSGFGIEDHVFKNQDIMHLIRASNVKGIATALRRSVFLIPKIPEVIYMMVNNNLEIEAVDIAYTFGLERACLPAKILTTYLQKKSKEFQSTSPLQMLEAGKQHLSNLILVKQCLESHNVDPSTLLPDFKINEKIQNLERVVNKWELTHSPKRKYLENPIHHEAKRACASHQNMPHQHRPIDHYGMNWSNRSTEPSTSYITNHAASPVYDAYARPENIKAGGFPGSGFPGSYDQTVHTNNNQPYGWRGPYGQHYPTHGQTYGSQPDHRPWEQDQLESFPGFLGRQPPPSDLYSFAKLVEKGSRGSCA